MAKRDAKKTDGEVSPRTALLAIREQEALAARSALQSIRDQEAQAQARALEQDALIKAGAVTTSVFGGVKLSSRAMSQRSTLVVGSAATSQRGTVAEAGKGGGSQAASAVQNPSGGTAAVTASTVHSPKTAGRGTGRQSPAPTSPSKGSVVTVTPS